MSKYIMSKDLSIESVTQNLEDYSDIQEAPAL